MAAMNNIVDPDKGTFRIYSCEQLFRDVWAGNQRAPRPKSTFAARIEEAVARAQAESRQ
jgi:hypothetical protein